MERKKKKLVLFSLYELSAQTITVVLMSGGNTTLVLDVSQMQEQIDGDRMKQIK